MNPQIAFTDESLTEIEVLGLNSSLNLADGHSYLDTRHMFADVINDLPQIWDFATKTSIPAMEEYFKETFSAFYNLQGLSQQQHYSICPTASNSIDIVGAWANATKTRIGLIEPTFDNLALLLRRRGVDLHSVPESAFHNLHELERHIRLNELDAIFLVNPNNPTGRVVDKTLFSALIAVAKRCEITVILDTSFRFGHLNGLDEYIMLQQSGLSYVILEDTGKIWPTLDTKASILSYSEDIAPLMRRIYEELYLCSSNFSLALVAHFIKDTQIKGGLKYIQNIIKKRLNLVEQFIWDLPVYIDSNPLSSNMSVAWLNIESLAVSDLNLVYIFAKQNLAVLPGRYFYWNSHKKNGHTRIRIALLKPEKAFRESLRTLRSTILSIAPVAVRRQI